MSEHPSEISGVRLRPLVPDIIAFIRFHCYFKLEGGKSETKRTREGGEREREKRGGEYVERTRTLVTTAMEAGCDAGGWRFITDSLYI